MHLLQYNIQIAIKLTIWWRQFHNFFFYVKALRASSIDDGSSIGLRTSLRASL